MLVEGFNFPKVSNFREVLRTMELCQFEKAASKKECPPKYSVFLMEALRPTEESPQVDQ